jgi:hypothetical protein
MSYLSSSVVDVDDNVVDADVDDDVVDFVVP